MGKAKGEGNLIALSSCSPTLSTPLMWLHIEVRQGEMRLGEAGGTLSAPSALSFLLRLSVPQMMLRLM